MIDQPYNKIKGEMELAKKIQTVLLPELPEIPGYDIAAYMKPAEEVGGDYYDVINIGQRHWLVIGDVSGHGVPAGLVMMMVQTAIQTALDRFGDASPEEILGWINRVIYANIEKLGESKYMTITLMCVEPSGSIRYSGLHQDILVYRHQRREVVPIGTQGMWLGVLDNVDGMNTVEKLHLAPGDVMLLFTDGIVEATGSDGKMYGDQRLLEVLATNGQRSPAEIRDKLLESLSSYHCDDDITAFVVKKS